MPAPGGLAGGVLTGHQAGEPHEQRRGRESAPVDDLSGQNEPAQIADAAVGGQPVHRVGQGFPIAPAHQVRLNGGQLTVAGLQHAAVVRVGQPQRRVVETLRGQPPLMLLGPRPTAPIDAAMAQQKRLEPLTNPAPVGDQIRAGPAQIPYRFLGRRRDPDRGQLPGPVQPGQPLRVPAVGLNPVPGPARDQRRRDHIAAHPQRDQQPVQLVTSRAGLVTGPQDCRITQPGDQTADRRLIVENPVHHRDFLTPAEDPHRDRVLSHVHPQMDRPTKLRNTKHERPASLRMWLCPAHHETTHEINRERNVEPAVPC